MKDKFEYKVDSVYLNQLQEWVKGNPIHRPDQCCPDFSCCQPELLAPKEIRETFLQATIENKHDIVDKLLMTFLGAAMNKITAGNYKKIHIIGEENITGN